MEEFPLGNAVSPPAWETLLAEHPFDAPCLAETLAGGQAFRWFAEPDEGVWLGVWENHVVRLRLAPDGRLEVQRLTCTSLAAVRHYLGTDRLPDLLEALPCRSDPVLEQLRRKWGGLSLLRQPVGETLLAFICSANKQILQIRSMLNNLAEAFGRRIPGTRFRSLPDWERLAAAEEPALRACALGYRAGYVAGTAAFLRQHPGYLEDIRHQSLSEARVSLLRLPGVGPKVADCVLLFAYGRMEAFPVDTWIARLMVGSYPDLAGWNRAQIATFARLHYGRAAGLAQQWLFAERTDQSDRLDKIGWTSGSDSPTSP